MMGKRILTTLLIFGIAVCSHAATIALWDFNDPSLGASNIAALPDSDGYTVWREAATDSTGNGNHLTTWDYPWAGFIWSSISPEGDFSIKAAGSYPAAYTWSDQSSPGGTDLETASLTQFTIEGVFTVAAGSGSRTLVGRDGRYLSDESPSSAALYFQIDWDDHPAFEYTDVNSNRVRLTAAETVTEDDATWYHMAAVSDGSTVSLYLDHELVASTDVSMDAIATGSVSGGDWHAGGWSVGRGLWNGGHTDRWFGYIDSIAISDTALDTNTFVLDVPAYTNVVPPPPSLPDVTNDTVYLMCYHEGPYPSGGSSGVFLSWSTNGYNFYPVNYGHPVFVPPEFPGDDSEDSNPNLVRDPSIVYGPDGLYHLVFTSAISSRSFGYAESPDLVHWSNVKLVQIWQNELDSIDHTWAPEIFYDAVLDQYMIAFSSGVGGNSIRIWYTTTTDFANFTDPVIMYWNASNPTGEQIDGFVAQIETNHYVMAYKDNAQIWVLDSSSPTGPWTNARQATDGGDEGPCLFRIGDTWHLYYDNYGQTDDVFGMAVSTDTTNWTDVTVLTDLPAKADVPDYNSDDRPPHHCTVFAAPLSTLGAFTTPLQDNVTNLTYLVHRWSFDQAADAVTDGTSITDSVSGAVAVVNGNRANFTGTGLQLPGDTDGTGDAAYFDLPDSIISSLTNLTVEIWATPVSSKNWQRLFSFGSGSSDDVLFWSINQGSDINQQRLAMQLNGGSVSQSDTTMDTSAGTQYHYVFTFEDGVGFFGASGGRMTFYRDGLQIGWRDVSFRLQDIEDVNNWLGRSQWSSDSNSNVEYNEVRIYSEVLAWYDIYGHYLAGPDMPVYGNPILNLGVADGTSTLTWPGNVVGLTPEYSDELSPSNTWTKVTNVVENTTNGLTVALPLSSEKAFYRLGE